MPTSARSNLSGSNLLRHEQRQHHARHEQHGDQRHAAHEFDEDDREQLAPSACASAARAPAGCRAAARPRCRPRRPRWSPARRPTARCRPPAGRSRKAVQQDERADRQHDEEIERAEIAPRRFEPQQPDDADRQHREEDIDAPALGDRIGAVDEIRQPLPDERPAGADLAMLDDFAAGIAVGAGPDRVDEQKLDEIRE